VEGPDTADVPFLDADQADDRQCKRGTKNQITGHIGELCRQLDAKMVDQCLKPGDDGHEDNLVGKACRRGRIDVHADPAADRASEEAPGAGVDGAQHGDEPEKIEPRSQPAGESIAEDGTPVIETARRWVSG
jgi:hypothetical protein